MKKLLLSCLGICLFSSVSFAIIDPQCYSICQKKGFGPEYCEHACSYYKPSEQEKKSKPKRIIDGQCYSICQERGFGPEYCEYACSYYKNE
jgi:hypothetical protein